MKGILKKLILVLLLCSFAVAGLLAFMEYHAGKLLIDEQVGKRLHTVGTRLSLSLRQSLYELDRVTTHDTILSEFSDNVVQAIIIWDHGRQHVVAGFERQANGSLVETTSASSVGSLLHGNWSVDVSFSRSPDGVLNVGEVDVYISRGSLENALEQQLKINLMKVLLTVSLILLVMSKIINSYLVYPLERIHKAMRDTKAFYRGDEYSDVEIERLTELFSENWTDGSFRELRDMERSFREMIVAAHDKQMALSENEKKYRQLSHEFEAVLDGLVDSLMLFDRDKNLVWGNKSALAQFELAQEEIVEQSCHTLWGGDGKDLCETCIEDVFRTGNISENICTDHKGRTWGVKAYPVFGNNDKVVNVIQIASDLSEKFKLREDVARTAHLAALGELSAGVAHEINNPTGLILMAAPFVKDAVSDLLPPMDDYAEQYPDLMVAGLPYATFRKEILQTIEDIQGGALRVKRIVNDLKDFAREEAAGEEHEVDLREMADKSLRLLHNVIKNSTDHFIFEVAEDLPRIQGSLPRLEQVLVNLVQNACQALTSREQSVTLRIYRDDSDKLVVIELSDQGSGIPKEIINKITDPFFTTRRDAGGTGLGLSVSTRIVDEHGGVMKVASRPGQGSTFTIKLPVCKGEMT